MEKSCIFSEKTGLGSSLVIETLMIAAILSGSGYALLVGFFLQHWRRLPVWGIPAAYRPQTSVAVLIPARNEEVRIADCLEAILAQEFPRELLEVVVIDDHSTDTTAAIVGRYAGQGVRLLPLSGEGPFAKKAAIRTGIDHTRGRLIVTTDADCVVPPRWLAYLTSRFEQHDCALVAGPVRFAYRNDLFSRFQALDFLGMMVLTGAGIASGSMHLCNGANLAYRRSAFEAVGGFAGHDHRASGEDVYLLHRIREAFPEKVAFLKQPAACVVTQPAESLPAFFWQRLRWAAKSGSYREWQLTAVPALVFVVCAGILLCVLAGPFLHARIALVGLGLFAWKALIDHFLLREATRFFRQPTLMKVFFPAQILHVVYFAVIGLAANLWKRYPWKGRWMR